MPRRWAWIVGVGLAFAGLLATWVIGMPRGAGPDEPAHTMKAYAVAHGELLGDDTPGADHLDRTVHVPADLTSAEQACFAYQPELTAGCAVDPSSPAEIAQVSGVGTYPPAYYAVVGGVARAVGAAHSLRAYRAVSALIVAALLALAAAALAGLRRGAPVLLLLGLTPMALQVVASVNASAIEVGGMLALWSVLAAWLVEPPGWTRWLAWSALAAVLVVVRPVSLAWVVLALAVYLVLRRGRPDRRTVLAVAGPLVVAVGASVWWSRHAGLGLSDERFAMPGGLGDHLRLALGHTGALYEETVGVLGWLDTRMPFAVMAVVTVGIVGTALAGLVFGTSRLRAVIVGTVVVWIAYPVVYAVAAGTPLNWQGRYNLAVLGILVVTSSQLLVGPDARGRRLVTRSLPLVALGFVVVEVLAFHQALRRFMVGAHGSILLRRAGWHPGVNAWLLIALNAAVAVGIGALLIGSPDGRRAHPARVAPP